MITNKIGERDLDFAVLYLLATHNTEIIDTTKLKALIFDFVNPGGINLAPLLHRNDTAIDQIIRNIISHRFDSSNNIINRQLVTYDGLRLRISDKGKSYLDNMMKSYNNLQIMKYKQMLYSQLLA